MNRLLSALLMIGGFCTGWLIGERFLWRHAPKMVIKAQPETATPSPPERQPPDIEAVKRCINALDPDSAGLNREIIACASAQSSP